MKRVRIFSLDYFRRKKNRFFRRIRILFPCKSDTRYFELLSPCKSDNFECVKSLAIVSCQIYAEHMRMNTRIVMQTSKGMCRTVNVMNISKINVMFFENNAPIIESGPTIAQR